MAFSGIQKTLTYTQMNQGAISDVFPLLCPVREADWLDGWDYTMIHSTSGLIEQNCVFTTPHHGEFETVWHVTRHDPTNHYVEFVRLTPGENVVNIKIQLKAISKLKTEANIEYQ